LLAGKPRGKRDLEGLIEVAPVLKLQLQIGASRNELLGGSDAAWLFGARSK
jgi:hypothetical protein